MVGLMRIALIDIFGVIGKESSAMAIAPEILVYVQSEKAKAGLIWLSQGLLQFQGRPPTQPAAAENLALSILEMVRDEVQLGWRLTRDAAWQRADSHLQQAAVMLRSGAAHDAPWHLTLALRQVTGLGRAAHRRLDAGAV
jgi:ABC-type taurine transport system ATPase subunit